MQSLKITADQTMPVVDLLDSLAAHGSSLERREALYGVCEILPERSPPRIAIVEGRSPASVKLMEEPNAGGCFGDWDKTYEPNKNQMKPHPHLQ